MRSSILLLGPWLLSLCALLGLGCMACGPEPLPAFANPPPPPDAASDAAISDDDAGHDRLDAGTH
jgi:hypothetical protein